MSVPYIQYGWLFLDRGATVNSGLDWPAIVEHQLASILIGKCDLTVSSVKGSVSYIRYCLEPRLQRTTPNAMALSKGRNAHCKKCLRATFSSTNTTGIAM